MKNCCSTIPRNCSISCHSKSLREKCAFRTYYGWAKVPSQPTRSVKKAFEEVKKVVAGFDVTVYVHAYGDNNVTKAKAAGAEE